MPPTTHSRPVVYLSEVLEWLGLEDHQPGMTGLQSLRAFCDHLRARDQDEAAQKMCCYPYNLYIDMDN